MTVDEFVEAKVLPEHREVVALLRRLVREMAPDAKEKVSYGMPVYIRRQIFAWIIPTKKDITFGFTRGIRFEDKYGLLKGVGKSARHVKVKSLDKVNEEALRYYITQALALDAE